MTVVDAVIEYSSAAGNTQSNLWLWKHAGIACMWHPNGIQQTYASFRRYQLADCLYQEGILTVIVLTLHNAGRFLPSLSANAVSH